MKSAHFVCIYLILASTLVLAQNPIPSRRAEEASL
jgi:hypothetical protein